MQHYFHAVRHKIQARLLGLSWSIGNEGGEKKTSVTGGGVGYELPLACRIVDRTVFYTSQVFGFWFGECSSLLMLVADNHIHHGSYRPAVLLGGSRVEVDFQVLYGLQQGFCLRSIF